MKVSVGIADSHQGIETVDFLLALDCQPIHIQLAYVLEVWNSAVVYGAKTDYSSSPLANYFQELKEEGHKVLNEVAAHAKDNGAVGCDTTVLFGSISNELLDFADHTGTDLLVLGSSGKSPIEGIVLGSTSRKAIINCQQSVLIVKNPPRAGKKELTAVFATDHSPYGNQCLEKFWSWKPSGIKNVIVLSIYSEQVVDVLTTAVEHFKPDVSAWVRDALTKENDRVIQKLGTAGVAFENRVECGSVGDRIAEIMQQSQADLLVLGSQGHGFLERLSLGSISLEQAFSRDYSVLVMRV